MSFNQNFDGIAPNCPCVKECPNRSAYCRGTCEPYKKWRIEQKIYSNKVRWIRKKQGMGVMWNSKYMR